MRPLLVVCILLAGHSSGAQVKVSRQYVKVLDATQRRWSPGTVQKNTNASGGFIFQFRVKIKRGGDWQFQQGVFDNKSMPIEVTRQTERNVQGPWRRRELLTLVCRTDDGATATPVDEGIVKKLTQAGAPAALVLRVNDEWYLVPIKKIKSSTSHQQLSQ